MVSRFQRFGLIALFAAMMCLPAMAGPQAGGKPGAGKSPGGQGGGRPTPTAMAARMIQQFDSDGDQSLNATELAAAIESMRSRRGSGGKAGGGQGAGGRARGGKGPGRRGPGGKRPGGGNGPNTGNPN